MLKRIPIAVENFKEIIEENYYYIDKTKFIEEILNDGTKVKLFLSSKKIWKNFKYVYA